MSGAQRLPCKR